MINPFAFGLPFYGDITSTLLLWVIPLIASPVIAAHRNRDWLSWLFFAALGGPLALIVLFLLPVPRSLEVLFDDTGDTVFTARSWSEFCALVSSRTTRVSVSRVATLSDQTERPPPNKIIELWPVVGPCLYVVLLFFTWNPVGCFSLGSCVFEPRSGWYGPGLLSGFAMILLLAWQTFLKPRMRPYISQSTAQWVPLALGGCGALFALVRTVGEAQGLQAVGWLGLVVALSVVVAVVRSDVRTASTTRLVGR